MTISVEANIVYTAVQKVSTILFRWIHAREIIKIVSSAQMNMPNKNFCARMNPSQVNRRIPTVGTGSTGLWCSLHFKLVARIFQPVDAKCIYWTMNHDPKKFFMDSNQFLSYNSRIFALYISETGKACPLKLNALIAPFKA